MRTRSEFAPRTAVAPSFVMAEAGAIALDGRPRGAEPRLAAEAGFGTERRTLPSPIGARFAVVGPWVFLERDYVVAFLDPRGSLRGGDALGSFFRPRLGKAGAIRAIGFPCEGSAFVKSGAVFCIATWFSYKSSADFAGFGDKLRDARRSFGRCRSIALAGNDKKVDVIDWHRNCQKDGKFAGDVEDGAAFDRY